MIALGVRVFVSSGKGKIREISMSKIKNKMPTMKNCVENGKCCPDRLVNPHSNADAFAGRSFIFIDMTFDKASISSGIPIAKIAAAVIFIAHDLASSWKLDILW